MLIISPKTKLRHALTRRGLLTGAAALSMFEGLKLSEAQTQSPCGSFFPASPPTQAQNAGMTALKFVDDFNVPNTVAPTNSSALSGYNWWPNTNFGTTYAFNTTGNGNGVPPANISVFTNATAGGITNGASAADGGPFPSPNGGVAVLTSAVTGNGGVPTMVTVPPSTVHTNSSPGTIPASGTFDECYIEIYCQWNPNYVQSGQWPGLVLYSQQNKSIPGQTVMGSMELDQMENYLGNFSFPPEQMTSSAHCVLIGGNQPAAGGGTYGTGQTTPLPAGFVQTNYDGCWHLFGYLKQHTSSNSGSISVYYDNVLQNLYNLPTPILTGPGGSFTSGWDWVGYFNAYFYSIAAGYGPGLGNSATTPGPCFNVDYVRIWGKPS